MSEAKPLLWVVERPDAPVFVTIKPDVAAKWSAVAGAVVTPFYSKLGA